MDGFPFEGGQITARKLRQEMTAYSEGALQTALENGCKDRASVIFFLTRREQETKARHRAGSRRGARNSGKLTLRVIG